MLLENYGSFFQHYALRQVLALKGFSCLRYLAGRKPFKGLAIIRYFARRLLFHPFEFVNWVVELLSYLKFSKAYRNLIGPINEICSFEDDSVCVVGSDQILSDNPEDWFSKANPNCKRIIYAGSCDWLRQRANAKWHETARTELPRFQAVSVRECAGIELCQQYVGEKICVERVMDPVFLLDSKHWSSISEQTNLLNRPTLLVYLVNLRNGGNIKISSFEKTAEKLGCDLKIIAIQGSSKYIPLKYHVVLSPTEFLAAVRDAKYVVTNSFHGSAFSIIFKKSFAVIEQKNLPGFDFNNRQNELLRLLGLEGRFCGLPSKDALCKVLLSKIDYDQVCRALHENRNRSLKWLEEAING